MILSEAQQKSAALMTSMVNEALAKAQHDVNQSIQQGEKELEFVKENVQKQALLLKTMAKEKEREAIKLVLSSVI